MDTVLVLLNLTSKVLSIYFQSEKCLNAVDNSKERALSVSMVSPSAQILKRNYFSVFINFHRAFSLCNFPLFQKLSSSLVLMLSLKLNDLRNCSAADCAADWWLCLAAFFWLRLALVFFWLRQFSAQLFPALDERNSCLAPAWYSSNKVLDPSTQD